MSGVSSAKELLRDYERDRDEAASLSAKRTEEVYAKCPRVREIDEHLNQAGMSMAKKSREIFAAGGDAAEIIAEYDKKAGEMLAERAELLKKASFPENYETDTHKCNTCKDTGFLENNERCSCYTRRLIKKNYALSNLNEKTLEAENFGTFNINYYSEQTDEKNGISPRDRMKLTLEMCLNFTENFGDRAQNLYFYGAAGLGKTFLCNCIAKDLLDKGKSVFYTTAPALFKRYDELRFARFSEDETDERATLGSLVSFCDLLIIDDLGAEFTTNPMQTDLFEIINSRILSERPVVISSNLTMNELNNQYSDRVTSRIAGNYSTIKFFGGDVREIKKYRK
ncbi:DNA replication protein DnaC [Clostridia bacterium]|nr:DNA replication protein DnaC [Clostridia bacterium]